MKAINKLIIAGAAILLFACNEPDVITPNPLKFGDLQNDTINKRENIVLQGENMGINPAGMKILIDSTYLLGKDSIKIWNNARIEFIPPQLTGSHTVRFITDKDTSKVYQYYLNEVRNIDFKLINAGTFLMGSELGLADEQPAHTVKITKDFFASVYEISQAVYIDVCDTNPSIVKSETLPVHNVKWIDAVIFCNKLSELKKLKKCYIIDSNSVKIDTSGTGYRLPTEAEWEYICRAGTTGDFNLDKNINEIAWYNGNSGYQLKESGKLLPNAFGLYDMHGNLWEWCQDYYSNNYYTKDTVTNPTGAISGTDRVLRGGSYKSGSIEIRASNRSLPADKLSQTGIRLIKNK